MPLPVLVAQWQTSFICAVIQPSVPPPKKNPTRCQTEAWWHDEREVYRKPTNPYTDGANSIYFRVVYCQVLRLK